MKAQAAWRGTALAWLATLLLAGCMTTAAVADRPDSWAQPVTQAGLPNLYQVDAGLWRSALPDTEGFAAADALDIRTVVNLRPAVDAPPAGHRFVLVQVPMHAWSVTPSQVMAFLWIATDPARQPVLVHCQHGADRTGVMVASYRMVVQGWSEQQALREMTGGGYGYHPVWINLPRLLRNMDVAAMRRSLGIQCVASVDAVNPAVCGSAGSRPSSSPP